jgi:hypothetical protein
LAESSNSDRTEWLESRASERTVVPSNLVEFRRFAKAGQVLVTLAPAPFVINACNLRNIFLGKFLTRSDKSLAESDVRNALLEFEPIWNELFPAEQARLVGLLVERVDLRSDCIDLCLRIEA